MYDIIKNVILSRSYELADVLKKIDVIWLQGDISDDQRAELVEIARTNATPENSYAAVQEQLNSIFRNIAEVAQFAKNLEKRVNKLEGGEEPPEESEEWPEYVQPVGAHDAYHRGDKVTYNGKHYTCIAPEGVAVVWDPETYPDYWQLEE